MKLALKMDGSGIVMDEDQGVVAATVPQANSTVGVTDDVHDHLTVARSPSKGLSAASCSRL